MKFRKWILTFVIALLGTGILLSGFNYVVDPFGVFGDKLLKWYSYDMTNNPRVSKIAYLDKNHDQYDSYIIGGSKSSSLSPELLNQYYGDAKFYSMLMYGGDFHDYEKTLYYLVDHYTVKHIVLHMSMQEIGHYNEEATDFKQSLHAKVTGEPLIPFYLKYLTLNPSYGYSKLEGYAKRAVNPYEYSVFIPENGVYNKVRRDAEKIDNLDQFMANNPAFSQSLGKVDAAAVDKNVAALKRMKEYCDERNIDFKLITGATYSSELESYNLEELKDYWAKLAEVTDFWDFSGYTSITNNPRYFYDPMHYRNNLGEMMLGYMFKDPNVYVPKNFGHYTTRENVREHAEKVFTPPAASSHVQEREAKQVPILLYHHLDPDESSQNSLIVSPDKFKSDMLALKQAGYEAVFMQDLIDYVDGKKELPEKPVVITLDDGYLSNYQYAYPVLKELGMKGTISAIGWSMGRDAHRIEGKSFFPHFGWQQAREMVRSGVIEIQNHSYDMHEMGEENSDKRLGVLQKKDEPSGIYAKNLQEDALRQKRDLQKHLGIKVNVFTYPMGYYSLLSEQILSDAGYRATLTTDPGVSRIVKGSPGSLFGLKRINAGSEVPSQELVRQINEYTEQ